MKKIILSVLLGLSILFLGVSCYKSSTPSNTTPVVISQITIKNFAFDPATITVAKGTVVTWKNEDSTGHQIISDGDLPDLLSGIIEQNGTFSFTFDNSGTWKYHCNIHPTMKGEVIVN